MTELLQIDCSPRRHPSHSRQLVSHFITNWQNADPDCKITYRDLGHHHQAIPPVTETYIYKINRI